MAYTRVDQCGAIEKRYSARAAIHNPQVGANVAERQGNWAEQKALEREQLRVRLIEKELGECSFVPKTNDRNGGGGHADDGGVRVHDRLHQAAVMSRTRLQQKAEARERAEAAKLRVEVSGSYAASSASGPRLR